MPISYAVFEALFNYEDKFSIWFPSLESELSTNNICNIVLEGKLTRLKISGAPGPAFDKTYNKAMMKQLLIEQNNFMFFMFYKP
jgi:hypothetical protein